MRSRQERQGFEAGKKKFVSNLKVWRIYEIVSQGVYSLFFTRHESLPALRGTHIPKQISVEFQVALVYLF
jgi:hypothetical protein